MALLTTQEIPVVGEDAVTFAAADVAGDSVTATAGALVLVRNGSAAAITLTVTTPGTVEGLAIQDPQQSIPAGATGAFPVVTRVFGATMAWTYSAVTTVTVAVVRPVK